MAQVLTANRLSDGEVVYLASDGSWVEAFSGAKIIASPAEGEHAMLQGQEAERRLEIVHAYLFDLTAQATPLKKREIIRAAGPTVRQDLGKQARS